MKTVIKIISAALMVVFCLPAFAQEDKPVDIKDARARRHVTAAEADANDVAAEIQFGREVGARVLGRYGLYEKDQDVVKYVALVGTAVALRTNRPELSYKFAILDSDEINAYAAPGGYIFITKGAILQMKDESELAAVLAHEIAHVNERHIVSELNIGAPDASPVAGFARFLGGAGDPAKMAFLTMVDKAMEILFERGYKRSDEKQADELAAMYLAASGYDPSSLDGYLERVRDIKQGAQTSVLSKTHPPYNERINALRLLIRYEKLMSGEYKHGGSRFNEIKRKI